MSAVPNIPDGICRAGAQNPGAALQHLLHSHAETIKTDGHTNGTASRPPWLLHDTPIENLRPMRIIVIGAGYSGIYCAIRIPEKLRNCELVCYEKNSGVGGTWFENRYPGVACDIASHSYQFSFNPKPDWSAFYAPGAEIREYLEQTAAKYGANRFIKLEHQVTRCTWDDGAGKWHVTVQPPANAPSFVDTCDVVISARGLLNTPQWPEIPGLDSYAGALMHSAAFETGYDFTDKRVGVIGSGSSAIQIIPALQKVPGARLSCFIRSKTWVSPPLGQAVQDRLGMGADLAFSRGQMERYERDPEAWLRLRLMVETDANSVHAVTLKGTPMQRGARMRFEDGMKRRLAQKPEYFEWLRPDFAPCCRRLTPGPGFLEALVQDNVAFVRDKIDRVEEKGVVTEDGRRHEVDALVCATGFYASAAPPFQVSGVGGYTLQDHWRTRSYNYMSLATNGFPNHFFMLGPNGAIGEGSLLTMIESAGDYIIKAVRKMQKENIKSMEVKAARVRDFTEYSDRYFAGTVFKDDCHSWYRKDGQGRPADTVTGLWPGSCLHNIEAMRSPRWEDYTYEYLPEQNGASVNRLAWLGNGWAVHQLDEKPTQEQMAFYVIPKYQDLPLEGRPEDKEEYKVRPWSY